MIGQLAVDAAYGFSVAGLGDVNNDGYDDVAVGAPATVDIISGTGTLASVGAVFIYYGSASGLPVVPSAKLQPTTAVAGALFGYSIAGGDINNDGKADIIVGAPLDNVSLAIGGGATATGKVGKAYVFNGATLSTNTTPFLSLQLSGTGILENGVNLSIKALFGFSVAVTEDLNNDGKKDIIVGAPTYAGVKAGLLGTRIVDVQSGGAFVFLSNNANSNLAITKLEPVKTSLLGLGLVEANISGLLFGYSVDGLGDYNGDGKPDVVATAPAGVNAGSISALLNGKLLQGSALVYYGNGAGVNTNPGATLTATSGGLLTNLVGAVANVANLFGTSVKGVRDGNGTRNGNVLVGAPLGNAVINVLNLQLKTGTVSVFKKKASSPSGYVIPDQSLTSPRNSNNILQVIQSNLLFGYAIDNVLDINCDGYGDIIVGEPASSGAQLINANVGGGAAYVYLGKADGTYQAAPAWTLTATADAFLGINATSLIGYSVAGAGKVKGASCSNRILIGSPSRSLDFGTGLLNLGNTFGTLFSLVAGNNGVGKAFSFDTKLCVAPPIMVLVASANPLCCNDASGSFTLTAGGGTGGFIYSKDGGASFQSSNTFTGLAAGTYNWVIKDAAGNTKTGQVTISNPPSINADASVTRKPTNPETADGSFKITASGGTGTLTYSKDGGNTFQASNIFTGVAEGMYTWVVKDANNCRRTGVIYLACNGEKNGNHVTAATKSIKPAAPVVQIENSLNIYPNPCTSFVNISFVPSTTGSISISLYSMNGKYITTLYKGTTETGKAFQQKLNLGKPAAGAYIIRLENGNTITNQKLFILD
ncbi:MAG: FG-GAP-like repeat-containing protein [Ferruginibacter sp.]